MNYYFSCIIRCKLWIIYCIHMFTIRNQTAHYYSVKYFNVEKGWKMGIFVCRVGSKDYGVSTTCLCTSNLFCIIQTINILIYNINKNTSCHYNGFISSFYILFTGSSKEEESTEFESGSNPNYNPTWFYWGLRKNFSSLLQLYGRPPPKSSNCQYTT